MRYLLIFIFIIAFSSPAMGQQVCGKRADFVKRLDTQFKESTAGVGLINGGSVIEVLTSQKGSWTILMTGTNGMSCVVASGEAWEHVPRKEIEWPEM